MMRDPILTAKKKYYASLNVRKIFPLFFHHTCCKCHMEFKLEPMFEASYQDDYFTMTHYHTGCSHCFTGKEDFKNYVKENHMHPESAWRYKGQNVTPIQRTFLMDANDKRDKSTSLNHIEI